MAKARAEKKEQSTKDSELGSKTQQQVRDESK